MAVWARVIFERFSNFSNTNFCPKSQKNTAAYFFPQTRSAPALVGRWQVGNALKWHWKWKVVYFLFDGENFRVDPEQHNAVRFLTEQHNAVRFLTVNYTRIKESQLDISGRLFSLIENVHCMGKSLSCMFVPRYTSFCWICPYKCTFSIKKKGVH